MKWRKPQRIRRRGFSLIATLLIVAMVAIAIVGFLSVVTTETTTTRFSAQRAEARANAMVGLRKAIAQLQEHAGPDQRVTAVSSILEGGASDEGEGGESQQVFHRYWTGVWSTTGEEDGGGPWIERESDSGSLIDRRSEDDSFYEPASKQERALVWLVSGDGSERPLEDFEEDDESVRTMRRRALADEKDHSEDVRVRTVEILESRNGETRIKGHYAYWVADEGVKAKINVFNPYHDTTMSPDKAAENGYRQLYVATTANYSLLLQNPDMDEEDKRKILTSGQLMSYQKDIPQPFTRRLNRFHSTTAYSLGVLCDVRDGGLKQDLSAFLMGGGVTTDLRDDKPIVDDFSAFGPDFGRLRSWARSGEEAPFDEDAIMEPYLPIQHSADSDAVERAHLSIAKEVPDFTAQEGTVMKPLLVEAALYHAVSRITVGESYGLRMHIYPRVVLWNPYSVALEAERYAVVMTGSSLNLEIDLENQEGTVVTRRVSHIAPNTEDPTNPQHKGNTTGTYGFSLDPIEIGPGECLVFSSATSVAQPYSRSKLGANVLSAKVAPGTQNFYLDDCFTDAAKFPPGLTPIHYTMLGGELPLDGQMQLKVATSARFTVSQLSSFPLIQTVSCGLEPGLRKHRGGGVGGGGGEGGSGPLASDQAPMPPRGSYEGCRMRWLIGADPLAYSLVHFNLHAALHLGTPWYPPEVGFGSGSLYVYDIGNPRLELKDFRAHKLKGGKWGGNPLVPPSVWALDRYVMFDVPRQHTGILSLAQFQHAPVSAFGWDPLYPIGNSFLPIHLSESPARTVPEFTGGQGGWNGQMFSLGAESTEWIQGLVQEEHESTLVFDTSYESNHALWDRFYLSGANSKEMRDFANDPTNAPLPNTRLVLSDFESRDGAEVKLTNGSTAASNLLVNGAFNVNSTEPEAWAVVLAANRGRFFGGEENLRLTPFPRFADPADGASRGPSMLLENTKESWSGFRVLNDTEIEALAGEIVSEVKKRGPFLSMADFVNRRLTEDETGKAGALQAAIDQAGINSVTGRSAPTDNPVERAAGGPWFLSQADVLTPLGPILTARSDTFLVKAYGDAVGLSGKVVSRAGCEAIVQRTPELVDASSNSGAKGNLGRKFRIVSFRWTNAGP